VLTFRGVPGMFTSAIVVPGILFQTIHAGAEFLQRRLVGDAFARTAAIVRAPYLRRFLVFVPFMPGISWTWSRRA